MRPRRNARPQCLLACLPLFLLAACVSTLPEDRVTTSFYDVAGNTLEDIERNIAKKGPRGGGKHHNIAVARFRFSENIDLQSGSNECSVRTANFNFSVTIVLPRWKNRSGATSATIQKWERVVDYAVRHEQAHVEIARRHLNRLEAAVMRLPSSPRCSTLRKNVNQLKREALARLDAAHIRFDQDENARFAKLHGEAD